MTLAPRLAASDAVPPPLGDAHGEGVGGAADAEEGAVACGVPVAEPLPVAPPRGGVPVGASGECEGGGEALPPPGDTEAAPLRDRAPLEVAPPGVVAEGEALPADGERDGAAEDVPAPPPPPRRAGAGLPLPLSDAPSEARGEALCGTVGDAVPLRESAPRPPGAGGLAVAAAPEGVGGAVAGAVAVPPAPPPPLSAPLGDALAVTDAHALPEREGSGVSLAEGEAPSEGGAAAVALGRGEALSDARALAVLAPVPLAAAEAVAPPAGEGVAEGVVGPEGAAEGDAGAGVAVAAPRGEPVGGAPVAEGAPPLGDACALAVALSAPLLGDAVPEVLGRGGDGEGEPLPTPPLVPLTLAHGDEERECRDEPLCAGEGDAPPLPLGLPESVAAALGELLAAGEKEVTPLRESVRRAEAEAVEVAAALVVGAPLAVLPTDPAEEKKNESHVCVCGGGGG